MIWPRANGWLDEERPLESLGASARGCAGITYFAEGARLLGA